MLRPPKIIPDVAVPTIPMIKRADIEAPAMVRAVNVPYHLTQNRNRSR